MTVPTARSLLHPAHPARKALVCLLLLAAAVSARADDRGILRTGAQVPYVFVIFDSSGSMATLPSGAPAPANGDDPQSKFYFVKQVAYEVFGAATNVNFGFSSFNQDNLRVIGKHWIYTAAPLTTATLSGANFPVPWPNDGEQWVFGTNFPAGTTGPAGMPAITTPGTLGSCTAGVSLSSFTSQLDRFPKLQPKQDDLTTLNVTQADSNQSTVMYVTVGSNTYKYTVSRDPGASNPNLGAGPMAVEVAVDPCPGVGGGHLSATVTFNLGTPAGKDSANNTIAGAPGPFLMNESAGPTSPSLATVDDQNGFWNYSDVLQSWACGGQPFSGMGQEGNYDGTYTNPPLPTDAVQGRSNDTCTDSGGNAVYCDPYGSYLHSTPACYPWTSDGTGSTACTQNLKHPTFIAPPIPGLPLSTAALDSGDLLPWNWNAPNQGDFLSRLAPNQLSGAPDFTQAGYFFDFPDPTTGFLPLKDPSQIPLIAAGPTPLGAAIIDFRCWLIGSGPPGGTKCKNAGNYTGAPFSVLANTQSATWGCAKPFMILITDGNDTCKGPDPTADVANLKNKSAPSVTTWVIDIGADCTKPGNPIQSITRKGVGGGGALLVCPTDTTAMRLALQTILGKIQEQSEEFATAAVPEVQASTSDKVYLSDFNPTGDTTIAPTLPTPLTLPNSTWEGHVNAFLKPLPIKQSLSGSVPDTTGRVCTSLACSDQLQCFLWDAGVEMKSQVSSPSPPYVSETQTDDDTHRRLFYSMFARNGTWAGATCGAGTTPCRRLLTTTVDGTPPPIRYDLWSGFQLTYHQDNPGVDESAQSTANNAINAAEALKMHTFTDSSVPSSYILGDIFHSNPLIVGTPPNVKYFALNLNATTSSTATCDPDPSKNTQSGYQCFATRHANRRKLLLVGSNDGMLHAFDVGQPHLTSTATACGGGVTLTSAVTFDNGSGREVWAYMPRAVMATVNAIATGTNQHWTVDGPPQAADVFIDPLHTGTPDPSHREWRTIAVGGLREGPETGTGGLNAYYALDITQPDQLSTASGGVQYFPTQLAGVALPPSSQISKLVVPDCDGLGSFSASCGVLPYPSPLWEFYDQAHKADGSSVLDATNNPVLIDEDNNGTPDLGHTWSTPTIGRIQIADADGKTTIDKYVAIFGGGLDRGTKTLDKPAAGNWLYMVDVETGKAIYKQKLNGCAAATAAAVDTTQAGVINRIYMGTTSGHMYRVDLGPNKSGKLPTLATLANATMVLGTDGIKHPELRLIDPDTQQQPWTPREIFNANFDGSTPSAVPRSLYFAPSVIFDAHLGLYALAFGTGDREDLWSSDASGQLERYYVLLDDTDLLATPTVLNESDLTPITLGTNPGTNVLETGGIGHRGWFLTLGHGSVQNPLTGQTIYFPERVTTNAFALSGVNVFSTFTPAVSFGGSASGKAGGFTCTNFGAGNIIASYTQTGGTILEDSVPNLITDVGPEIGQTKNVNPGTSGSGTGTGTGAGSADVLTTDLLKVMNTLKQLFPRNCKFGNFRIDIKAHATNTGVIFVAPVPVCIIEKNWKEY